MHPSLSIDCRLVDLISFLNNSSISPDLSVDIEKLNNKSIYYKFNIIKLGNYYNYTIYQPLCIVSDSKKSINKRVSSDQSEEYKKQLKDLYYKRSKKHLKDLILCNLPYGQPKFLTLTYRNAQFSKKKANSDFKNFIKRLKYSTNIQISYIAVSEEHDSERTKADRVHSYHFHVLIFNLPYISAKIYSEVWKHGFIKINRVFKDHLQMANYLAKYLSKVDRHEKYSRRYLFSKNLLRPVLVQPSDLPLLEFVKSIKYNRFTGGICHREIYKISK